MRSSAITSALINYLLADTALRTLTPDGVFFNVAGASMATGGPAERFVVVSVVDPFVGRVFGRRAYQHTLYLVEARILASTPGDVHAAAARLDALLDPQPPSLPCTFPIPGWALMACYLEEPTELVELDDEDSSIQWNRCGGRYDLWAAPTA